MKEHALSGVEMVPPTKEQQTVSERNGPIKVMGAAREPISRASLSMEERWRKSEDGPIMETWERTSGFSKRDE